MKTLDQHNKEMQDFYDICNKPHKNGISCPVCGNELIDSNPGVVLDSCPPQYHTHCNKCNYKGYRIC